MEGTGSARIASVLKEFFQRYIPVSITKEKSKLLDSITKPERAIEFKGTESQYSNQPCILENFRSAGTNIVKYVKNISAFTMSCKYYNKKVSNFELGNVQKQIGAHLAEYVDFPNLHLKKNFNISNNSIKRLRRIRSSLFRFCSSE